MNQLKQSSITAATALITAAVVLLVGLNVIQRTTQNVEPGEITKVGGPLPILDTAPSMLLALAGLLVAIGVMLYVSSRKPL